MARRHHGKRHHKPARGTRRKGRASSRRLRLYVGLRIVQALALALTLIFGVFLVMLVLGTPEREARGALWFDFLRANLSTSLWIGGVALGFVVVLGLVLEMLGRRWKRDLGKYR